MYLVISKWRLKPGMEDEARRRGRAVRSILRSQPDVTLVESIYADGMITAVHGYANEEAYQKIVHQEGGPFAQAVSEHRLEEVADWVESHSGSTED